MTNASRVEMIPGIISWNRVKGIYKAKYQKVDKKTGKGTLTVELRQEFVKKSYYPSIKLTNEKQGGLFDDEAFGIDPEPYIENTSRVAWVPVPEHATPEMVDAMVKRAIERKAIIYKALSFRPLITEDQQYAIDNGLKSLDDFARTQAARYGKNEKTIADGTAGTLLLDKVTGNIQYRDTYYWPGPHEDEDFRDPKNVYVSDELLKELTGAVEFEGQTVS